MQIREELRQIELRQIGHNRNKKSARRERGKNIIFRNQRVGKNIVFRPKYRPLLLRLVHSVILVFQATGHPHSCQSSVVGGMGDAHRSNTDTCCLPTHVYKAKEH